MRPRRTLTLIAGLAVVALALPSLSFANHVSAHPAASALLGKRIGDRSWQVKVSWAVNCEGPAPGRANYYGSLRLVDAANGG